MKPSLFHGIYLSIITIISFLFFLKIKSYDKVIKKSNETLSQDFQSFERQSKIILDELKYRADNRPRYGQYFNIAKTATRIATDFDSSILVLAKKTTLSDTDYADLKKRMKEVRAIFISLIDAPDRAKLSYLIPLDTSKNGYSFDSKIATMNELNIIKNEISKSKLAVMNYYLEKSSNRGVMECGPSFRLAFYPRESVLIEGEHLEAEIALTEYSRLFRAFNLKVNNQPQLLKEGVAVFKGNVERKIGKHKIEASTMVKDVISGDSIRVKGEFNYLVLPKCSRDCAKNQ